MSEDIEVNVRQIDDEQATQADAVSMDETLQKLILAGIGAVSLAVEETDKLVNQLVERGEAAKKDNNNVLNQVVENVRKSTSDQSVQNVAQQLEQGLAQLLKNINIPTRQDVDDLSAKIDRLAERVEQIARSQK